MRLFALTAAALSTAALGLAQCPFNSIATQSYGQPCDPLFFVNPALTVALNAAQCELQVNVNAFVGCCGTLLAGSLLTIGDQQAAIPVPQLGANCTLLVQPAAVLFLPVTAGATYHLPLPSVLVPPLTIDVQGGVLYFTAVALAFDFAFSSGTQVQLQ